MMGGRAPSLGTEELDAFCRPPGGFLRLPSLETEEQLQEYLFSVLPDNHAQGAPPGQQSAAAVNPSTATDTDTSTPLHAVGVARAASLEFLRCVMGAQGEAESAISLPGKMPPPAAPPLGTALSSSPALPQPEGGADAAQPSLDGSGSKGGGALELPACTSASEAVPPARASPLSPPQRSPSASPSPSLAFAGLSSFGPRQHILVDSLPGPGSPLAFRPGCSLHSSMAGFPAPFSGSLPPPPSSAAVAAAIMPLPLSPARAYAAAAASAGGASPSASPTAPRRAAAAPPAASAAPNRGKAAAAKETATKAVIPHPESLSKQELRRARRMISNRESARRSRKRKQEQLGDLEEEARVAHSAAAEAAARAARCEAELAVRDGQVAALRQEVETLRQLLLLRTGYAPSC